MSAITVVGRCSTVQGRTVILGYLVEVVDKGAYEWTTIFYDLHDDIVLMTFNSAILYTYLTSVACA